MKVQMLYVNGKKAANQFIITDGDRVIFQSYSSPIVEINYYNKTITVYRDWRYSTTTSKYRNLFMKHEGFYEVETTKDFEKHIKLGKVGGYAIVKAY